jgi:hypothetical protein
MPCKSLERDCSCHLISGRNTSTEGSRFTSKDLSLMSEAHGVECLLGDCEHLRYDGPILDVRLDASDGSEDPFGEEDVA